MCKKSKTDKYLFEDANSGRHGMLGKRLDLGLALLQCPEFRERLGLPPMGKPLTLFQIAVVCDCTPEGIRRIEKQALAKLNARANRKVLNFYGQIKTDDDEDLRDHCKLEPDSVDISECINSRYRDYEPQGGSDPIGDYGHDAGTLDGY